jgi:hypothetical protein
MTIGYFKIYFGTIGTDSIFAVPLKNREHSSAGSEHLPYKQRVTGSNPVAPTTKPLLKSGFCISYQMVVEIRII